VVQKYDLRSRTTDYIVVVASSDAVLRFYDLDKLHVQACMRWKDCVCTCLAPVMLQPPGARRCLTRPGARATQHAPARAHHHLTRPGTRTAPRMCASWRAVTTKVGYTSTPKPPLARPSLVEWGQRRLEQRQGAGGARTGR